MITHPALTTDNLTHFKVSVNASDVEPIENAMALQEGTAQEIQEYFLNALIENDTSIDKKQFSVDFSCVLSSMVFEYYRTHTGSFDMAGLYDQNKKNLDLHINGISQSLQIK